MNTWTTVGYNAVAKNAFTSCWLPKLQNLAKFRENSNLQVKVIQGRRSWCQSKVHMQLPINSNFGLFPTVFEKLTFKARKLLVFPTPPLVDVPARGNPLEFLDETYPAKTTGMGLPYGENFTILNSTVFDWSTHESDGQTGGRAISCRLLSICCRALKIIIKI